MKTKLLLMLLAVLFALSASADAAPEPVLPTLEKGPYLIYTGVNTEMMVLWQLDAETTTTNCTLKWGRTLECTDGSATTTEFGDYQHEHVITDLLPGTKYFYQVTVDGVTYPGSFTAAPEDDVTAVKILAFGDTRSQPKKMDDVTGQMINTYKVLDPEFQTIALHSGDWVNSNAELDWAEEFFNPDCANNREFQANVPIAGARGNHEGSTASLYKKYYPYPYTGGVFYGSFDYGPVHVVIIDQYTSYAPLSPQHNWLIEDLIAANDNENIAWKIAVYHAPAWGSGWHSNSTAAQNYLHPLFVEHNVPIIINGHNHNYIRCDVDGIQHITSGGGGAPLYVFDEDDPFVVACARTYHHCEIDINGDVLNFKAFDSTGFSIDSFTLEGAYDDEAPTPDPMTFATKPYVASATSIAMEATTAEDDSGVEYYFTCTDGGGHNSGWQDSTTYEDTDIALSTTYFYTVMARDKSVNHNTTAPSEPASAALKADKVKIGKAKYSIARGELKVEATSTAGGYVTLTVVGYGEMTYYATQDTYKYSAKPVDRPEDDTVTVTSTGGGVATKEVKSR